MELAQELLLELGLEPPISHDIVASMRDVISIDEAEIPWAGCLVPGEEGLAITLRAGDSHGKQRFTAFHEIKHTFMPGFRSVPQYRCDPAAPPPETSPRNASLEALCDVGAAELLFPRSWFSADLAGNEPTLDLIERLAIRYDASLEATARRLVTLYPEPALLVGFEPACKPTQPNAQPALRVQWAYTNTSGSWPFVPKHKSVPESSVFGRALNGERVEESATLKGLTSASTCPVHVSSRLYPYIDNQGEQHMRVLALITPTRKRRSNHAA
ncbi:ImmA/IrrE family metallo-endopeptidase [Streptomyces sp. T21Q-yed]|uniref:ImmA/IrrE family metallo-endopeptidase n=1 Tax=Streptomyces sp. T21Q-yed TaxID=3018441 RepID=UPI0023DEF436|nr:ImmA/IrrE family metallo-endopeptidase [Streptomyces sp. T21Q-yed]MDF3140859.1 ImmA/IrrE family metallo-endopeptidase [Streptomyces sp. T21Q-yed]